MEELEVLTGDGSYPILFSDGFSSLKEACERAGLCGRKLCIVTDSNVDKLYAAKAKKYLEEAFSQVEVFSFPAGEERKNQNRARQIRFALA